MNILSRLKLKSLQKAADKLFHQREQGGNVDVKHEANAQLALANFYRQHLFDKGLPNAERLMQESYRNAALLGSLQAQYQFGKLKLQRGKFWQQWAAGQYGRDIHETYAKQCYQEAFNYLSEAEQGNYPQAVRLHGMAYIHGWGIEQDKDKGFKLIVKSIDLEEAWDRATQIFEELGLNTPEFFSTIMAIKEKK